ncbi:MULTISPECIES: TraR/DksA family transcriptional regulator [unclassified Serinicoccus]|uniref:TraR/DksA family transcriptional regulator n=1 Tax=unclassified Serinicoccus TaxID=2643101 RepID=UPI003855167C
MTAKQGGAATREQGGAGAGDRHEVLSVREGEDPWTAEELAEVRGELEGEMERLRAEVEEAEQDLVDLKRSFGDGAGDDQADAGAATWEREHELSVTNNARNLVDQHQQALARIDAGTYGDCESCGTPIGKMRLQAFPRATLCLSCKQKQERR